MHALAIFPRSGFDQSVTTPVLLGVLVSWFFTETFGWVFAGLVVPGYLASVFLLDPAGGLVDILEAVITYGVARFIGEHLSRTGLTSRVFGRERFFLVVLVSILVRLGVEAWVLPRYAHGLGAYSVGLVVVPLAANACWKTGLFRGLVQNGVPTLIVYLLLREVFVKYTNLSLAGFELSTENVAASFLASPKAYILLVTGALLAAGANLRYGWDFNGILVPALLGLALFEPLKFASTFVETIALYVVVLAIIRLTPLKRANIEGPRRTVLFFSVDYAARFAFAAAMGKTLPGGDIVAFMGFGYLLPTLLAVKISQKGSAPLVLLPTLKVSALGFAVGTLVGFGATLFDHARGAMAAEPTVRKMPAPPHEAGAAALWASVLALEDGPQPNASATGDVAKTREMLDRAAAGDMALAARASLEVSGLDGGIVLLRERFESSESRRGLPTYLYRPSTKGSLVVVLVPSPLESPALAAAAGALVGAGSADAAIIAGIEEDPSTWLETTAHAAARWLATQGKGTLVTLYARGASSTSKVVAHSKSATAAKQPALDSLLARFGGFDVLDARANETAVALDERAIANALMPRRAEVPLGDAIAMSNALEDARPASEPLDLEDVVALRRLVLEPLLSPVARDAARALAPFAASALGYRITAPSRWRGGREGVALLPASPGRALAVFAANGGVKDRVVEAPLGARRGVRDLVLREGDALHADAIIVGGPWVRGMHGDAARAAHAAATSVGSPQVFVVRENPSMAGSGVQIGAWMDDGHALAAAQSASASLGLAGVPAMVDLPTRELATRTLLRPSPLVMIVASPSALDAASLDDERRARARFAETAIAAHDESLADAARALVASLDAKRAPAPEDIAEMTRRAASDASVTAAARLAEALRRTTATAMIVRAAEGTYLLVVARTPSRTVVAAAPVDTSTTFTVETRDSAKSCVDAPIAGGACQAGAP